MIRLALALLITSSVTAQPFRPEAIRAHMEFLADDLLEGRATATRGHEIAARYVAAQFALAGVEPGAESSYFQDVPFLKSAASPESTITFARRGGEPVTWKAFEDFTTSGDPLQAETQLAGDLVFAGYGITAPDQRHDDYERLDVKGKFVAIFSGAPPTFPTAVRAHHSSSLNKTENAVRHGAIGLIYLQSPKEAARTPWHRSTRQSRLGSMHWLRNDGTPNAVFPTLSSTANLSLETTKALLGTEADAVFKSLEQGRPRADRLGGRIQLALSTKHDVVRSPNVVGLVRGSDPQLRDEYLVYSAHLDHLGITEPVNGDAINNGAFDNASGVACLLEIARTFAALPTKPRRSILFLATTAEEKGLRGADYFASNPTVPVDALVANINIDMLVMTDATRDLIPIGAETSDLGDVAADVAREMKVELSPDPFPEEVVFVRSDQYPFVRRGIPAIYIDPGYKPVDPSVDVSAKSREWLRARYHMPGDDLLQPIDYRSALLLMEFDYRLGLAVANRAERPRWKPGDFFGRTFGRTGGK